MTKKTLLTAAILISFAAPALADQYYIVRGPDRHCTVTTTKPTEQTTVTQIGPLAFESRERAEDRTKGHVPWVGRDRKTSPLPS